MATEKATAATASKPTAPATPKPPPGFAMGGTPDIEGWFKPEKGMVLFGTICGAIQIPDEKAPNGKRDVVLVRLKEACKAVLDQTSVLLEPGQVIGVGVRHQLSEMLYYVESKGDVWAYAKEQVSIGHGQTMWKFDVAYKGERRIPPERFESGSRVPSGPVPF
jgi:hypothetical protein